MDQNLSGQNVAPNSPPAYVPPPLFSSPPPPPPPPVNNYQQNAPTGKRSNRKLGVVIVLILLIVGLPLTIFLTGQKQDVRQRAAEVPDTTVVATVNGQPITKGDVRNVALEQYDASEIDNSVLAETLKSMEEDMLLDNYAASNGVDFSDAQYSEVAEEMGLDLNDPSDKEEVKRELIKRNVVATQVTSRQAFDVGFWLPPASEVAAYDTAEKNEVAVKLDSGTHALTEIEQRLKNGEVPLDVAKDILVKNPQLKDILAVNGYLLSQEGDESLLTKPITYTLEERNAGQPFFDAIFSNPKDSIAIVLQDESSGGSVIKMVEANEGSFDTYAAWLADQTQQFVKEVSPL